MEKIQVTICGRTYNLRSDDGSARIENLAKSLEKQIKELNEVLKNKSESEVLTLVALNVLDETDKQSAQKETQLNQLTTQVDELQKQINALQENAKHLLQENMTSAGSEMEQIATIKDTENTELRKKLIEYERDFELLVEEKEAEIKALKESFESARGEMEHIAAVQETDNAKLRNTLNSYETSFDLYVKVKEEEITSLRAELEVKQTECDVLRQRLAAVSDDGQLTIC